MTNDDRITYTCKNCGWVNTWTRDEIARLQYAVVYRGDSEEYSLPCKNPMRPSCAERRKIVVARQQR